MNNIKYLCSIETRGIKMGIQRTKEIINACGNPQINMPSIQVAGTNGKGSVCAMLSNIFIAAGYKTGLFTSPHLVNVNERIRINGIPIFDSDIDNFILKYKYNIENIGATFFETITAMAFWFFKKNNVDIAILETGLGGRLDSVTICDPILTIITPISLDHIEILGNNIKDIAFEKAGIMKKNIPCISSFQKKTVKDVLIKQSKIKSAPLHFIKNINYNYDVNINGSHQQDNANLCIQALSLLKNYKIPNNTISFGLKSVKWFGRNQIIKKKPLIIFDVAHNTDGIQSFFHYYKNLNLIGKSILIISLQARKNIKAVIPLLIKKFDLIICTEAAGRNPMNANTLKNMFCNNKAIIIEKPEKAILKGLKLISNEDSMAIIGSHYLGPAISKIFKISFDKC